MIDENLARLLGCEIYDWKAKDFEYVGGHEQIICLHEKGCTIDLPDDKGRKVNQFEVITLAFR